ncbi:hypothetical protein O0880_05245 [Janthinobacterium sp. SUN118]|uniref:hypothetical protein n=1 Tax=Janthinobacterium sp. SUN118 TaxID=3004100 RepID=UPI0025B142B2|nr:hypothetical protein [Janthinobacterium sp. SUN118]MDN2708826.1 hypothetical protein [Janthinobacterium sp. SUN118]
MSLLATRRIAALLAKPVLIYCLFLLLVLLCTRLAAWRGALDTALLLADQKRALPVEIR